jgi:hypothetical protein
MSNPIKANACPKYEKAADMKKDKLDNCPSTHLERVKKANAVTQAAVP